MKINPITERVINECKRQNKSIYQLCKDTGISESTISSSKHYEKGWISAIQIHQIANYLNVSYQFLITGNKTGLDESKAIDLLKSDNTKLINDNEDLRIKVKSLLTTLSELMSLDEKGRNKLFSVFLKSE